MAEILRYRSGLPSFSEVLDIISRWSEREKLSEVERENAKEELTSCLKALEGKSDGMSGMVRGKLRSLFDSLDLPEDD
jgi:hypothetical protein